MTASDAFEQVRAGLIGRPLSHISRGYATAVFFEFGTLHATFRRDGSTGNPKGEVSVGLEFYWRIELGDAVICGSEGDRDLWAACFDDIAGACATSLALTGHVAELCLHLSSGHRIVTCSLSETGPEWSLTDHRGDEDVWVQWRNGAVVADNGQVPSG